MEEKFSATAWKCHTCGDAIDHGSRIVVLEDSVVSIDEFVPKADRDGLLTFCSDEHFLDYKIFDDMHSYRGASSYRHDAKSEGDRTLSCDRCGAPLAYGSRGLRIHDSTVDELETSSVVKPKDSSLFCSKHCAEHSMLWFRSKSIADVWDEVQRRVDDYSADTK